jgi:hypothetical protein
MTQPGHEVEQIMQHRSSPRYVAPIASGLAILPLERNTHPATIATA